ncbi:MAG: hypothetical protein ACYCXF_07575 [Thermoleophilia bacterium]
MNDIFDDRELIFEETAPGGEWHLEIFGPSNISLPGDALQPPFYASFHQLAKGKIIAVPFGVPATAAEITVKWGLRGGVCAIFIGSDCWVLFRYGLWVGASRQTFRMPPEPPFSEVDIEQFLSTGSVS